jgi:hypothetical protein
MKKRLVITVAVAFALAMVIIGTVFMSSTSDEPTAEAQATGEITEEGSTVESGVIDFRWANPTVEQIIHLYGCYDDYRECFPLPQSQADEVDFRWANPTVEQIIHLYGCYDDYRECFPLPQSQADDID